MSKYTIDSSTLTDIADAIRIKTGKSSQITPLEMPSEIASISGVGSPFFSKELIATTDVDNAPDDLVFTGDYTMQHFLEISMQNTSSLETNKFITSPEIITHSFTVSNNRYSINEADTNQYGCYILQQNGDWLRNTNRNLLIKEIYGWNCDNYNIIKTDFYKRDSYAGTNVIVNAPAGDSFYNYDFLFIATSTGDYDDAGDNPLIYPIRTNFGTDYKIGLGINKYYDLDGYILSGDTLSVGPYLYVQGIKFSSPKNSKSDTVLNYDDSMGYSSNIVAANNITNLLAYAFSQNKDLVVNVKVGTSTKSSDDVAFHFYWAREYLRCRFKHSTKQFKLQLGGGSSAWYTYVDTKAIKIRFNHSDNSIDIMQDGETTQHVAWPFSSDIRPLTNVPGSTAIYADSTWFEYLNMKIV